MAASVTLEALLDGRWHRAAVLEFPDDGLGNLGRCHFEYDYDYLDAWLGEGRCDAAASLSLPLEFGPSSCATWPSFLDDVRPMANARRWWLNRLQLADLPSNDFTLLRQGTAAPVGISSWGLSTSKGRNPAMCLR